MGLQAVNQTQEEEPPAIPARRDSLSKTSWLMIFNQNNFFKTTTIIL